MSTVSVEKNKRGTSFYQSTWQTTTKPYKEIFLEFVAENSDNPIGYGSFIALKPFYVRPISKRDIEMCCCKDHLHARWSVKALIDNAEKQKVVLPFTNIQIPLIIYILIARKVKPHILTGIAHLIKRHYVTMQSKNGTEFKTKSSRVITKK